MSNFPVFLGILEELVSDKKNKEIMVNAADEIYVDREGELIKTSLSFKSEEEVLKIAQGIAKYGGKELDSKNPILQIRVQGHFVAHVIIPPVSMKGTTITIFNASPYE